MCKTVDIPIHKPNRRYIFFSDNTTNYSPILKPDKKNMETNFSYFFDTDSNDL